MVNIITLHKFARFEKEARDSLSQPRPCVTIGNSEECNNKLITNRGTSRVTGMSVDLDLLAPWRRAGVSSSTACWTFNAPDFLNLLQLGNAMTDLHI